MVDLRDYDFELNEVNWWSNWGTVKWITRNSYVILSDEFDEFFFNRGGFIAPDNTSTILAMESAFAKRRRKPYILVQRLAKYSRITKTMSVRYEIIDGMSVLEMRTPSLRTNPNVKVEIIGEDKVREWCEIYLLSFYGDKKLLPLVERIAKRILKKKNANLLLARYGSAAAGGAAIYRENGLCGVYCVGTKPEFRNLRIATTLVERVHSDSKHVGDRVALQTMLSDEVEGFYHKLGFRRVYLKQLFKRMS